MIISWDFDHYLDTKYTLYLMNTFVSNRKVIQIIRLNKIQDTGFLSDPTFIKVNHLHNYFKFHICPSFQSVPSHILTIVSQNATKNFAWYVLRVKMFTF